MTGNSWYVVWNAIQICFYGYPVEKAPRWISTLHSYVVLPVWGKGLFTIGTLVINIIYFVLLDRLMMAAVQRRTGPYNVGYFGLLQPMDDGLKLVKNEVIIPKKSSCILFLVVPNLFFYCSLILWSIIPLEGFCYNMDFTFNIFLQLFISNVQVVTNMSSGVTSNSKYTTYGSLRIGGQILS